MAYNIFFGGEHMDTISQTDPTRINNIDPEEIYPYSHMFSPLVIQNLKLNNRIFWAAPVEVGKIHPIAEPSPELSAFLRERAAAGLSLAFVGHAGLNAERWGALARELNRFGCRLAVGISPPVPEKSLGTRRLNRLAAEIKQSAAELYNAGADAIYLDAAPGTYPGWMLARQDENLSFYYKTATQYLLYLITQLRQTLPAEFPLFLRAEPINIGVTLIQSFKQLGLNGLLLQTDNSFNGTVEPAKRLRSALSEEGGKFYVFAEMPAGRSQPPACEHALLDNAADAVVLSRALLAEANWPALAYAGREAQHNNCILCRGGCAPSFFPDSLPGCAVNPRTGNELTCPQVLPPVYPGARLAVIGAGPAGMQAALTAWERGFEVSLFDTRDNPLEQYIRQQGPPTHFSENTATDAKLYSAEVSSGQSQSWQFDDEDAYAVSPEKCSAEPSPDSIDKDPPAQSSAEESITDLPEETAEADLCASAESVSVTPQEEAPAHIAETAPAAADLSSELAPAAADLSLDTDETDRSPLTGSGPFLSSAAVPNLPAEGAEGTPTLSAKADETHNSDAAGLDADNVNLSDLTIGEVKQAAEKRIEDLPEGKAVKKDAVLEFMSQKSSPSTEEIAGKDIIPEFLSQESSLPAEEISGAESIPLQEKDTKQFPEPLRGEQTDDKTDEQADEQADNQLPSVSEYIDRKVEEERRIAWQRHCSLMLAKLRRAENSGDFFSYFQTEITVAMLAQNRFDIIIAAPGGDNGYEIFQLIQNSYVSPRVLVAGAAAGSKGLAEAIRSGYAAAASL